MGRRRGTPGWRYARAALESAAAARWGRRAYVGWASRGGDGLYRDIFFADVTDGRDDDAAELGRLIAAVPRWDAPQAEIAERAEREAALLARLGEADLPVSVPRWASAERVGDRTVLVRDEVCGCPMPMKAGERAAFDPLRVVAQMAAVVHDIDPAPLEGVVPVHGTRREHAVARLRKVEEIAGSPVTDETLRWLRDHLPDDDPAVVVHGDLLGQNIMLPVEEGTTFGLIDWEYCVVGDPAYDLSIATRGARRPFGRGGGRRLLVEAYVDAGGREISETEVAFHEGCMIAGWYLESVRERERGHPPEFYLQRMESFLRHAPVG